MSSAASAAPWSGKAGGSASAGTRSLPKGPRAVGGEGWRFAIGGHRFFPKVPEVERWWHPVLPDEDFLPRPRMSRILYAGKLFDYPLKPMNALTNLGIVEAVRSVASYVKAKVSP